MRPSTDVTARRTCAPALALALALGACHAPAGPVFRQEGPRAVEILDGSVSPAGARAGGDARGRSPPGADGQREALVAAELAARGDADRGLVDYTRDALNEIDQLFPRHENPEIALYVTPHQGGGPNTRAPVPGYTTSFDLYRERPYALPSEIAPSYLPPDRARAPTSSPPDEPSAARRRPVLAGEGEPLLDGAVGGRP